MGRRPTQLDPTASAAALFGAKVRAHREARDWSLDDLGERAYLTGDQISKIERAKRTPSQQSAARFDEIFGTGAYFQELWPLVDAEILPEWFRPYVEAEGDANCIRTFGLGTIHGLLQTEAYAADLARIGRDDDDDVAAHVAARMKRQEILDRANPPRILAFLDEFVLHRLIGGPERMREQIVHLIKMAKRPNITVQIIPADRGAYAGLKGAITILSFDKGPDAVYLEDQATGRLIEQKAALEKCEIRFDWIRASALSQDESFNLLRTLLERL